MVIKGTNESTSRWYYPDGRPCHTVLKKDGEPRKANLADARKLGLIPSVTTILKVLAKPGLEGWKISQAIVSALTLPRDPAEDLLAFAERVAKDSQEEGLSAAKKGTNIHRVLEILVQTGQTTPGGEIYQKPLQDWMRNRRAFNPECEIVVVGDGYAGRMDLRFRSGETVCYADFKTQDVKKGKPNIYDEYAMQLSAYSQGDLDAKHISIIVDRTTGELFEKEYSKSEIQDAWEMFQACKKIWYLKNKLGGEK